MKEPLRAYLLISDAVIITDSSHRIIDVNKTYEDITGYKREQIRGAKAGILKSKFTTDSTYRSMYESLSRKSGWSGIFINKKKNGGLWHSSISITPILLEGDWYYVGIFRELEHLQEGIYIAEERRNGIQAAC